MYIVIRSDVIFHIYWLRHAQTEIICGFDTREGERTMLHTGPASKADQPRGAQSRLEEGERGVVATLIPVRLERLPWGRFHVLVITALGVTWILDGLEVTLAGSVAGALKSSPALRFSDSQVGLAAKRLSDQGGPQRVAVRLAHRSAGATI